MSGQSVDLISPVHQGSGREILRELQETMSAISMTPELQAVIAPVLGRIPSGVFILCAGNDQGSKTGMLASWVQQAAFEPPQVTVAVNKSRFLNQWLKLDSPVTLNQVAKGDSTLLKHFGKGFEPDADAFEGIATATGKNGQLILSDALGSLEGTVSGQFEAGDHILYLVTITFAHAPANLTTNEPFVHIRKNGFNY